MKKNSFIKNTFILTLSNLAMGILRFVFSIILSNHLGAQGTGLYTLIMPIYDLFCCLVCGGIITAISKESSIYYENKDFKNLYSQINITIIFILIWSSFIAFALFLVSPFISFNIINDSRSLLSIKILCPAIVFIAISSVIKGYFYGTSNVILPAFIDIIEKTARILIVIILLNIYVNISLVATVTLVYVSLALGELISLIFLYIFYKKNKSKKKQSTAEIEGRSQLLFNILIVSIPLCINGFLSTALSALSTLILPLRLVKAGFYHSEALSIIGRFNGMALSISFFPIVAITSMSLVLVPDISKKLVAGKSYELKKRIEMVLNISILIGIATSIICFILGDSLAMLFYGRDDIVDYIKYSSLSAPFVFASMTSFSILSGLGKQSFILMVSIITSVLELMLLYILTAVPFINIYSYIISIILTCLTCVILNVIEIRKISPIKLEISKLIIYILVSILALEIPLILNNIISFNNQIIKVFFNIIFIYGFCILLSNYLNKEFSKL